MSDLISRQDAIDALERTKEKNPKGYIARFYNTIIDNKITVIKDLPSVQPEIIRCEDCMHNGSFDTDCPIDWAGKEYCSFAERRTDEKKS